MSTIQTFRFYRNVFACPPNFQLLSRKISVSSSFRSLLRRPIRSFDRYATYLLYEKQEREQLSDRCVNNAVIIRCSFCWFSYAACGPSYFAPRIRHSDCPRIAEQRSDRKQRTTMSNYFVSFERESQARSESSRATRSYFGRADRYAWPLHD